MINGENQWKLRDVRINTRLIRQNKFADRKDKSHSPRIGMLALYELIVSGEILSHIMVITQCEKGNGDYYAI